VEIPDDLQTIIDEYLGGARIFVMMGDDKDGAPFGVMPLEKADLPELKTDGSTVKELTEDEARSFVDNPRCISRERLAMVFAAIDAAKNS